VQRNERLGKMMDRLSVLIVDDDVDFVDIMVKRLRDENLAFEVAHSGIEALRILNVKAFDVCVLEAMMPGMDGIQTLEVIKRRRLLTEVIILTREASAESGIRALRSGAFDYIMKPVRFSDLLEKMTQAHERKMIKEGKCRCK
jgi:DNA-binding NtrC family response regulator